MLKIGCNIQVYFDVLHQKPSVTSFQAYEDCTGRIPVNYPLSYGVPVRERYGSTLLPATREQHDQNCTQSH